MLFLFSAVTPAAADVYRTELITNGDFFAELTGWGGSQIDAANNVDDQYPLSGSFLTLGQIGESERASQTVTVPDNAGKTTLSFYYRFYGSGDAADYFRIRTNDSAVTLFANADSASIWTVYTFDLSAWQGDTVTVEFLVYNDAADLSFADVDLVSVIAESYPELTGIAKNKQGRRLRNASVTLRTIKNNQPVWKGATNTKGKFFITDVAGSKSYQLIIKKDQLKYSNTIKLPWAKAKHKTYLLK